MVSIIIFGGTGDLAKKKLFKSLYNLYAKSLIPKDIKIIGFARGDFNTDSYRNFVSEQLPYNLDFKVEFLECFYYFQGDLYNVDSYHDLRNFLVDMDRQYNVCSFKIFYLSVRPELYSDVFTFLRKTNILNTCTVNSEKSWSRVLIEKPFGTNFEHAKELDDQLSKILPEKQIFRIDHYLAKEALENILIFRFENSIFGAVWNKEFISKITIRLFEQRTIEGRGEFYDLTGALRDVGQNHALQMLAIVLMNKPDKLIGNSIRKEREKVLKTLIPLDYTNNNFDRAQYNDYAKHIQKIDSKTETYFKISLKSSEPIWDNIPFVIESGKAMSSNETSIQIDFKDGNTIYFDLGLEPKIALSFQVKDSGYDFKTSIKEFEFRDTTKKIFTLDAYEKILYQAFVGDVTSFVSTIEVLEQWKIIDEILKKWIHIPLRKY